MFPKIFPRKGLPPRLKEVYVDFYWSQAKLWKLEVPTNDLEIHQLDWILNYPVWYMDRNSVPDEVMKDPGLDPGHWRRVLDSDLSFPLHVIEWKERLLVLDGVHRLIKAKLHGLVTIKAKIIGQDQIRDILPQEIDFQSGFLKTVLELEDD